MIDLIEKHFRENYNQFVKTAKYRVSGNHEDAEDVVMEAYARAIQYKESFTLGSTFNNWFNRILTNCIKDWKREKFNRIDTVDEYEEEEVEIYYDDHDKKNLSSRITEQIQEIKNEEHKEIIMLYYMYGFNPRELKQIVNMKYGNIVLILQRFKAQMKEDHA